MCAESRDALVQLTASNPRIGKQMFSVEPRYGKYSAKRKGRALDSIIGICAEDDAEEFCRAYELKESGWFDVVKYDGAENAQKLARMWKHRMEFFYNHYERSPLRYIEVSEMREEGRAYHEPEDIAQWAEQPHGKAVRDAINKNRTKIFAKPVALAEAPGDSSSGAARGSSLRRPVSRAAATRLRSRLER